MKYEDKFQNIRQNTNIYTMGWYYAFFQKNFNTRSLIEKVEIIRILRECRKNSKHCDELYCGLWREPQYNYILNEEVNCLSSEEKKIYREYLQWLKEQKKIQDKNTKGERLGNKIAISIFIITCCIILYFIIWPVLKFVGEIAWIGFEIFADGSFLGFVFGVAAVIITLGMFATLVKAILGR